MKRTLLKSKIHRATVTGRQPPLPGLGHHRPAPHGGGRPRCTTSGWRSTTCTNGERFATYAIPGRPGSGEIVINGAAAHKAGTGDVVILATYADYEDADCRSHQPSLVFVDEQEPHRRPVRRAAGRGRPGGNAVRFAALALLAVSATTGLLTLACRGTAAARSEGRGTRRDHAISKPSSSAPSPASPATSSATWPGTRPPGRISGTACAQGDGGILPAEPPAVDFTRDMVLVAAMPTQSCVAKVTIRGVTQTGGELVVDLLEAPPAPNCVCIVAERPLHVVRLPKVDGEVRFDVEVGVTSC